MCFTKNCIIRLIDTNIKTQIHFKYIHNNFYIMLCFSLFCYPDENLSQNFSNNFLEFLYNFSKFLYNFITFSHFLYELEHFSENLLYIFSQNSYLYVSYYMLIMKYRKILKIFISIISNKIL